MSTCSHCSEVFKGCEGVPTHSFPKPCRALCPGVKMPSRLASYANRVASLETNSGAIRGKTIGDRLMVVVARIESATHAGPVTMDDYKALWRRILGKEPGRRNPLGTMRVVDGVTHDIWHLDGFLYARFHWIEGIEPGELVAFLDAALEPDLHVAGYHVEPEPGQ